MNKGISKIIQGSKNNPNSHFVSMMGKQNNDSLGNLKVSLPSRGGKDIYQCETNVAN